MQGGGLPPYAARASPCAGEWPRFRVRVSCGPCYQDGHNRPRVRLTTLTTQNQAAAWT